MTIAFWCVLAAIFMPYVTTVIAKRTMPLRENRAPRLYKEGLTGVKQRAVWACAALMVGLAMAPTARILEPSVALAHCSRNRQPGSRRPHRPHDGLCGNV